MRRIGALKKDDDVIGNRTRVKVVKNKMAPPFREVEFDILYGQGISARGRPGRLASEANIVDKSGAWFSFKGERIGQGRERQDVPRRAPRRVQRHRGQDPGALQRAAHRHRRAGRAAPAVEVTDVSDKSDKTRAAAQRAAQAPAPSNRQAPPTRSPRASRGGHGRRGSLAVGRFGAGASARCAMRDRIGTAVVSTEPPRWRERPCSVAP
ncbi:MAG: hypothetical protein R2939_04960 [Kofleriaceae bacterium]